MPYTGGLDILPLVLRQEVEKNLAFDEQVIMCAVPHPVKRASLVTLFHTFGKIVPSMHTWVATNRRVLLVHGKREQIEDYAFRTLSIAYKDISGVQMECDRSEKALLLWLITPTHSAPSLARAKMLTLCAHAEDDYSLDPPYARKTFYDNLLVFDDQAESHLQEFIALITDPAKTKPISSSIPATANLTAELMNLARLFRDGYLTQAEFNAAKKKLGL